VNSDALERKLAAILSADVVGYSRLMAEDEAATIRTLTDYREAIAMLVRQHRGRVVDSPGDNLLAEFPTALDAVHGAIEIQRVLQARNADLPTERKMEFRVGIHLGDVAVEGERIYGDGVNIAARLEGLAEPGGICVSATVHEQVRNKLEVAYEDLGDRAIKNIPDQVRVYRVQLAGVRSQLPRRAGTRRRRLPTAALVAGVLLVVAAVVLTWPLALGPILDLAGLSGPPVNPPLPDKPSVVVLPFTNLSGDPEQEYFSDGITEDLTTDLSRNPFLFVIARNSAFTYKGKPVKVEDVGRELGVRYVLEGSVRRAEDRVRISAQLIDASTGFHVWSDRYDRELADIFALQSEISEKILAAVGVEISEAELERSRRKPTDDLTAYDLFMRGVSHFHRFTREDNQKARRLFERALELDPNFAEAYAVLGGTYTTEFGFGWNLDPKLLDRAEELARRGLALNPSIPNPHVSLAAIHIFRGEPALAIVAAQRAIELGPSFWVPHFFLGFALAQQGRFVGAMQSIQRGLRLNPRAPSGFWLIVPWVNLAAGRKQEAVALFEQIRAANPELIGARTPLAAIYELEGRHEEARAIVQEILRVNPHYSAELAAQLTEERFLPTETVAEYGDALRRAGLP
jgi:adenylate cyclase